MDKTTKKVTLEDIWSKLDKLDKLDGIEQTIAEIGVTCEELKEKHTVLEKTVVTNTENIDELHAHINNIQFELNNLQQDKLENNIIINGIPTQENNLNVVTALCSIIINDKVEERHIKHIRRMNINTPTQPMVVTFHDKSLKIDLLRSWKKLLKTTKINDLQNNLKTQLNITNFEVRISISEENTRFTQNIFKETKEQLSNSFKYIWKRRGIIYVRKTDTSEIIKITSTQQLQTLKTE